MKHSSLALHPQPKKGPPLSPFKIVILDRLQAELALFRPQRFQYGYLASRRKLVTEAKSYFGDIPKDKWSCPRCGQNFCTPVSCFEKLKQQKQLEVASMTLNEQGGQVMSQTKGADMKPTQNKETVPNKQNGEQPKDACRECGATSGHTIHCSYNIAYII